MRQFLFRLILLLLVVLVIFGLYRLLTIRPLDNIAFFQDQPGLAAVDSVRLAGASAPSLAAFDAARQAGVNGLFLPVDLTRDGVLVVTDSDVSDLALAELAAVDTFAGAATLQDALASQPELRAIVELRQPSLQGVAALLQAIDANDARGRVLAVVDHPLLAGILREQAPDLGTATTLAETNAFLATQRFRLTPFYRPAAPAMLLQASQIDRRLVAGAHSRGIHLVALAAGADAAALQRLVDSGVDGVVVADSALLAGLSWPGGAR